MSGHRNSVFKRPAKQHKPWKGKRTKGEIHNSNGGRLGLKKEICKSRKSLVITRKTRRNQSSMKIMHKKKLADEQRKKFGAPPVLTTLLSLGSSGSPDQFINQLSSFDESIVRTNGHNVAYFAVPRFKARIGFVAPNTTIMDDVLDSLKVSDVLCLVWPLDGELSEWEELLLSAIKAHGMPTVLNIVPGLGTIVSGKKKDEARRLAHGLINKWNFTTPKLLSADTAADAIQIIRTIAETKKTKMLVQRRRAHMLVEKLEARDEQDGACTLLASGYVRGPAWNVNRLVHIPGWGDYQVKQIDALADPHPIKSQHNVDAVKLIATANVEKQESLQCEIVPDPLDGEQTWPDEHDVIGEDGLAEKAQKKRVPKGTSTYQAAWILNSDDEDDCDDEEDNSEDEDESEDSDGEMSGLEAADVGEEDMEDAAHFDDTATEAAASEFMDDEDIDMAEVEKYREERENAQFPDEVDTPVDMPARVRFQKYRGLKSFRSSPWDKMENLPYDYARIFKFQNFKKTKKSVLNAVGAGEEGEIAVGGQYVTIHIQRVPTTFVNEWVASSPLVLYQLLPHEQKMYVLNMAFKKHPTCTVPIISKTKLIFHVGFRKFEAEPVFSQHTNGDKFKMERYMPVDAPFVASVFAPITFPPTSILVFRKDHKGRQELVACGSVLDNNPDRIMLKRIVLSAHPIKINKRSVTARYMFFNREDIEWFKPVELYTPSGRHGHIREAVGTHGYMKCRFDQQLNAQDALMMSLYKRVFPKWTYNPRVERLATSRLALGAHDDDSVAGEAEMME